MLLLIKLLTVQFRQTELCRVALDRDIEHVVDVGLLVEALAINK